MMSGINVSGDNPENTIILEPSLTENIVSTSPLYGAKGDKGEKGDKGDKGEQGAQGEQGNAGFSPTIEVKTQTFSEYVLTVTNEDGTFDTPNLQGRDGSGIGDMLKSVYNINNDGIVDNSKKLGGELPAYYAAASSLANVATSGSYDDLINKPSIPVKISDLADDTATNPIDKADTLTGLTATVTELNYSDGVTSNIQTQLNTKQAALVSGVNIKTVNNIDIIGSGNIEINAPTMPTITYWG